MREKKKLQVQILLWSYPTRRHKNKSKQEKKELKLKSFSVKQVSRKWEFKEKADHYKIEDRRVMQKREMTEESKRLSKRNIP